MAVGAIDAKNYVTEDRLKVRVPRQSGEGCKIRYAIVRVQPCLSL